MMDRRHFLKGVSVLVAASSAQHAAGGAASQRGTAPATGGLQARFPVVVQLSPLPGRSDWKDLAARSDAKQVLRAAIDNYIRHGFSGMEFPFHLPPELEQYCLDYARSRGMFLTYNYTFAADHGVEIFNRDGPPKVSVYAAGYLEAVRRNLSPVLEQMKRLPGLYNVFCYQDEPFHAGPQSFDLSADARSEFHRRYGYDMPADVAAARKSPRQWLDFINFQSDTFRDGWRRVYREVKQSFPAVQVILTHDSHSAFGAGVGSNEKLAVDDVFHWGGDFADTFVFDIYPYMMFDYRYGECGKIRKPRMSQMHFAFAQMRNLAYAHGKQLGFWFGTFHREWFKDFMGPELKAQKWAEVETTFTAVAQGSNFLISGYKVPEDQGHWDTLGAGLSLLQNAPGLLACPKAKAKAGFLFPRTQYIQLQQEYWNVAIAYELFAQAFGELDCLHEEQARDHGIVNHDVLVLFDVTLLPEAVATRIADFVNAGGTVIADCVPHVDAYQQPLPALLDLFGVQEMHDDRVPRAGVWVPSLDKPHWFVKPASAADEDVVAGQVIAASALGRSFEFRMISARPFRAATADALIAGANGVPVLSRKKTGKGSAYLLGFCLQDTAFTAWKDGDGASLDALRQLLWAITQEAGVTPMARSQNPEIEVSLRSNANDAYVLAINHEAAGARTRVFLIPPFSIGEVWNIANHAGQPFERIHGGIAFDLEVPRDRPQILRLLRQ